MKPQMSLLVFVKSIETTRGSFPSGNNLFFSHLQLTDLWQYHMSNDMWNVTFLSKNDKPHDTLSGYCNNRASRFFFRIESFTSWGSFSTIEIAKTKRTTDMIKKYLGNLLMQQKKDNRYANSQIPWTQFWCCLYQSPQWSGGTGALSCFSWGKTSSGTR